MARARWRRTDRGPAWSGRPQRRRLPAADGEGRRRRDRPDHPARHLPARRRAARRWRRPRRRSRHRRPAPGARADGGRAEEGAGGRSRQVRRLRRRRRRRDLEEDLRPERQDLRAAGHRPLRQRRGEHGLRQRALDGRPLLLPERPQGLPRHRVHERAAAAARSAGRLRPGVHRRARDRPPRPEPARRDGGRQPRAAGGSGERERPLGPARAAGRLPRRDLGSLGGPAGGPARDGRPRGGAERGRRRRRRPDPEAVRRQRQPRHVHPRE